MDKLEKLLSCHSQLLGYQKIPDELLFSQQIVKLIIPTDEIASRASVRTNCWVCSEEITNHREVHQNHQVLCRSCAGYSYYEATQDLSVILDRF